MDNITKFINGYGQINYAVLKDIVSHSSLADFTSEIQHPLLVGKDLYDGELKPKLGGSLGATSTMRFNVTEFRSTVPIVSPARIEDMTKVDIDAEGNTENEALRRAAESREKAKYQFSRCVYILRKKLSGYDDSVDGQVTINIGRNGMNDIVIDDKVVSSKHAQIVIINGSYFITDLNSTNGTRIEHKRIESGKAIPLALNASIDFGRLSFVFAHPLQVYRSIRKEIIGM